MSATGRRRSPPHIAILGADGFIGSHAMEAALRFGASPVGLCVKEPWRLRKISSPLVQVPRGEWWTAEFAEGIEGSLVGIEALLLLAYTPPQDRALEAWDQHEQQINVAGVERILELASRLGVRVVFTSSADVYGSVRPSRVGETAELIPDTPYARAKCQIEQKTRNLAAPGDACILRLATVYGPGEDGPRAIPSFIRAYLSGKKPQIHGSGADIRDYVHVRDVGEALVQATLIDREAIRRCGGVLNIGSGIARSTNDVLTSVAEVMGMEAEADHVPSPRKPSRLVLDPSLAVKTLGFQPNPDFESGIREEVQWLRRRTQEPTLKGSRSEDRLE